GRQREGGGGGAAVGAGPDPVAPGGPGPPPAGPSAWAGGAWLSPIGRKGGGENGAPEPKTRHGGAPPRRRQGYGGLLTCPPKLQRRRGGERPASWDARRLARRLVRRVMAYPTGAAAPERFSALRPPLVRGE